MNNNPSKIWQNSYLEMTVTHKNYVHDEVNSRWNSGNACHHSVQTLLSSCLPSRKIQIKFV